MFTPRALPRRATILLALLAGVACGASTPSSVANPAPARRAAEPDARFVRGMIAHHAQALRMTALVPARSEADDMRLLAERIEVSQRDEIARMQQWLRARGEPAPDPGAPHAQHGAHAEALMPGMLTPEELARLEAATGVPFESLFLELMIRHHEGALTMVRDLAATDGALQDSELDAFARDVNADQSAEIRRMRALAARR
jgi:uncharacterized protein (DUF305 family)